MHATHEPESLMACAGHAMMFSFQRIASGSLFSHYNLTIARSDALLKITIHIWPHF